MITQALPVIKAEDRSLRARLLRRYNNVIYIYIYICICIYTHTYVLNVISSGISYIYIYIYILVYYKGLRGAAGLLVPPEGADYY